MSEGRDTPTPTALPPPPSATNPEVIADRYKVLEKLGQGGMGRVYRCLDSLLEREVAVKLLNHEQCDEQFVMRFQQEARASSQLNHPNILHVLDFGLTEKREPFMVMELVRGECLDARIARLKRIPFKEFLEIASQLCSGMQHAHRNGVIHRDLKPSNVMIIDAGEMGLKALILDFGIAKMVEKGDQGMTATGQIIGSPRCISPEQAMGEKLDGRSDVYSLGCMMFEMLTGKPPYQGENALETIYMHFNADIPSVAENLPSKIPDGLDAIVKKTMAKLPDGRFSSMQELQETLNNVDFDSIEEVVETTPEEKISFWRSIARNTSLLKRIALAGSCSLLFIAAVVGFMMNLDKQSQIPEHSKNEKILIEKNFTDEDVLSGNVMLGGDDYAQKVINREIEGRRNLAADAYVSGEPNNLSQLEELLEKKPKAYHLRLYHCTVDDDMADLIAGTKRFTELRLDTVKMTDESQVKLFSKENLKTLKLVNMPINREALKLLNQLDELTDFQLYKVGLKDEDLKHIATARNLHTLELDDNGPFTAIGLKQIAKLKELQNLGLQGCGIKDGDLQILATIPNVTTLYLRGCGPFTAKGLKTLIPMKHLKNLYVENTGINEPCLLTIARLPHLECLDLSYNKYISIGGLQYLRGHKNLAVFIAGTPVQSMNHGKLAAQLGIGKVGAKRSKSPLESFFNVIDHK